MENIVLIIGVLIIGLLLRRLVRYQQRHPEAGKWLFTLPEHLADGLTSFVIYISLPALVLSRIPGLVLTSEALIPIVVAWTFLAGSALAVIAVSKAFAWNRSVRGLLLLLVPLGNTSFVGIPMVQAFLGDAYVPYALLYDQFGSFIGLATYGTFIIALYGDGAGERKVEWKTVGLKIVAFPPFVALVLALATSGMPYPAWLTQVLQGLASTLVPLVITAVGFKLDLNVNNNLRGPLATGLMLKLIIIPLIALGACTALGLSGPAARVSIFEAAMPPQVAAWALAMKAGIEPELGASLVGYGIVLSLVTLPLFSHIL